MRVIIAPDSFKGSLGSAEIIRIVGEEAHSVWPNAAITGLPVADGGEGTAEALRACRGGELRGAKARDPLFRRIDSFYGILPTGEAVIESAAACGLPLLTAEERNPMRTTSAGLGDLIRAALEDGHRQLFVGLGGSATVDGGMGALSALGVRYLDAAGRDVQPVGGSMADVRSIDASGLDPRVRDAEITLLLDVTNPLTGEKGAAHIFGPQKGATPEMVNQLEAGMRNLAEVALRHGFDMDARPGSGAAGGLGGALSAFLGSKMRSGIQTILDLMRFDEQLKACDLVITGEGRVDGQSLDGKAVSGIAQRAKAAGVPVVALAGGLAPGAENIRALGEVELHPIAGGPLSLEESMRDAPNLLRAAAARLFGLLAMGQELAEKG